MSALIESAVSVALTVHVDPLDVSRGLDGNDEKILGFVCQLIAHTHSSDLRDQLLARLGVFIDAEGVRYEPNTWDDDEFLPREANEEG